MKKHGYINISCLLSLLRWLLGPKYRVWSKIINVMVDAFNVLLYFFQVYILVTNVRGY